MPLSTPPEITRVDMTTPILQLKSLGIDDLMKFEWVSAPPAETVLRALEGLHAAGMIDDNGRLTFTGEQVAECPVEVGIARMVKVFWLRAFDLNFIFLAVPVQETQMWGRDFDHCGNDGCTGECLNLVFSLLHLIRLL
jgi:hypothetical protein